MVYSILQCKYFGEWCCVQMKQHCHLPVCCFYCLFCRFFKSFFKNQVHKRHLLAALLERHTLSSSDGLLFRLVSHEVYFYIC